MSLKIFHAFFIAIAALMCFGVGAWRWQTAGDGDAAGTVQALAAISVGAGLVVYGVRFLTKYRRLSNL